MTHKSASLILLMSHDAFHLSVVEQLALQEIRDHEVIVLDTTNISASKVTSYSSGLLKLFGYRYPALDLPQVYQDLGCTFLQIPDKSAENLTVDVAFRKSIEEAIYSSLITYFRHHRPLEEVKRAKRAAVRLEEEVNKLAAYLANLLEEQPFVSRAFLPNGRFPSQKIAELMFTRRNIETWHYERGEPPLGIYLQNYPPQNRVLSQNAAVTISQDVPSQEIQDTADNWLQHRADPGGGFNEFAYLWDTNTKERSSKEKGSRKSAGFFSSSQDEFLHLGPEWQRHSWDSQVIAFDKVMTRLESLGYEIFLRIHPNLATKAHSYFKFEKAEFKWLERRHPNLKIYWHDEVVNTYELLKDIDLCIVWDSTVGLEASAAGTPTWTLATTRYGLMADVREVLGQSELQNSELEWKVDRRGALDFIYYLVNRDIQLSIDTAKWYEWNASKEPWQIQLCRIPSSGGNLSSYDSVISVVDTYRNRGIRANITFLKRRLSSLTGKSL